MFHLLLFFNFSIQSIPRRLSQVLCHGTKHIVNILPVPRSLFYRRIRRYSTITNHISNENTISNSTGLTSVNFHSMHSDTPQRW